MTITHETVTLLLGRAVKQLLSWGGGGFASYVSKKKVITCLIRSNIIIFVGDEDTFKSTERLGLHQTSCKI